MSEEAGAAAEDDAPAAETERQNAGSQSGVILNVLRALSCRRVLVYYILSTGVTPRMLKAVLMVLAVASHSSSRDMFTLMMLPA